MRVFDARNKAIVAECKNRFNENSHISHDNNSAVRVQAIVS